MNRIDRLMATLLLLQGRRVITAEEIALHFEISVRTVYRDISALSEGGVPVVAEAGVGYSLLNGYSIPPVMFTAEEASALFMGSELVEHLTDRSLQAPMRSALLKIRSVLPRSHQDQLDRLEDRTALLLGPGRVGESDPAVLGQLQAALARRQVLQMEYQTGGEGIPRSRAVEPLGLIHYAGAWHLIAFCRLRSDYRDFRTDRIRNLVTTIETFAGHDGFSVREYIEKWRSEHPGAEVQVRVSRPSSGRFRRAWMGAIVDERWDGDWLHLTVVSDTCDWLAGWLLGFGMDLEVLEPAELRERVGTMASQVAQRYGTPKPGAHA